MRNSLIVIFSLAFNLYHHFTFSIRKCRDRMFFWNSTSIFFSNFGHQFIHNRWFILAFGALYTCHLVILPGIEMTTSDIDCLFPIVFIRRSYTVEMEQWWLKYLILGGVISITQFTFFIICSSLIFWWSFFISIFNWFFKRSKRLWIHIFIVRVWRGS